MAILFYLNRTSTLPKTRRQQHHKVYLGVKWKNIVTPSNRFKIYKSHCTLIWRVIVPITTVMAITDHWSRNSPRWLFQMLLLQSKDVCRIFIFHRSRLFCSISHFAHWLQAASLWAQLVEHTRPSPPSPASLAVSVSLLSRACVFTA